MGVRSSEIEAKVSSEGEAMVESCGNTGRIGIYDDDDGYDDDDDDDAAIVAKAATLGIVTAAVIAALV